MSSSRSSDGGWGSRTLWVPNIRPRCLTCGSGRGSGGRRCRIKHSSACSTGEAARWCGFASWMGWKVGTGGGGLTRGGGGSGSSSVAFRGSTGAVGGRFPGWQGAVLSVRAGQRVANVSNIDAAALHHCRPSPTFRWQRASTRTSTGCRTGEGRWVVCERRPGRISFVEAVRVERVEASTRFSSIGLEVAGS